MLKTVKGSDGSVGLSGNRAMTIRSQNAISSMFRVAMRSAELKHTLRFCALWRRADTFFNETSRAP
jgi:hypothetical protein